MEKYDCLFFHYDVTNCKLHNSQFQAKFVMASFHMSVQFWFVFFFYYFFVNMSENGNGNYDRFEVPDMVSENPSFYCRLNQPLFLRVLSRAPLSKLTVCI